VGVLQGVLHGVFKSVLQVSTREETLSILFIYRKLYSLKRTGKVLDDLSKIFFKKCLAKYLMKSFCIRGFPEKPNFQCACDDNVMSIHVFIKKIFRAIEKAPLPCSPHSVLWGSSGSFQPEAVSLVMALKQ
jgi:hypothetical protein